MILLISIIILLPSVRTLCLNNGNYTANSTYRANLKAAFFSMSTNMGSDGFYSASIGEDPDRANAAALCRGDVELDMCRSCIRNTTVKLLRSCPYQKQAIDWPEFCMIRYSNETIFENLDTGSRFWWSNPTNATSPDKFAGDLRTLLDKIRSLAAYGGSIRKVAAGNVTGPDFQEIFALVQCTPDLSPDDCSSCLIAAAAEIPICCDRKRGGRVLKPSCTLHFEVYPFYNESRLPKLAVLRSPPALLSLPDSKKDSRKIIIPVVVIAIAILSICGYLSWIWIVKRQGKKRKAGGLDSVDSFLQDALNQVNYKELPLFKFEVLANATKIFAEGNKLGKGGFGPVYKGVLVNGTEIAVKRLSEASRQGMQEFMNEVVLISKLQHRNLVRLLGCCTEHSETMLVYEYMPNKSLDFFLFDPSQDVLDWTKRFKIIEGTCRGLIYLHRDSRLKIIHRDLKPSNLLLDNDWNPKISDFGLARIFGTKQDHVNTMKVVGTYGYMAPEYAMEGRFSEKSDIFSFGVLMLEIASGRRNTSFYHQQESLNLLRHVWKLWNEDNVAASIDRRISSPSYQAEVVRCIHIGLLCVQEHPQDRPSISAVLSMLNSEIVELPDPKQSAFAINSSCPNTGTSSSQQNQKSSCFLNNVTLTAMVDGR